MNRLLGVCAVLPWAATCLAQEQARLTSWVVIPVNEYGALRTKAYPAEREAEPPPAEATLTRVDYELRLDGALAAGRATLTIDLLKDGWVQVPIPSGLLVREAKLGNNPAGRPVSLVHTPGKTGQLSAVLSRKGRSVLTLDVAFPVATAGGEERLTLPASASGVTRAAVALAPQDIEVTIGGGFVAEKTSTRWVAYARGNEPLTFTWRKRIEQRRVELPLRMRGSLTQLSGLGEDAASLNAEVEIEVVQGAATQVRIAVPPSITIHQVPGANVADWDVKSGQLTVTFLDPVEHTAKFAIAGECHLAHEAFVEIPLLRLLEMERETGGVAVEVSGAGEIKDTKSQGLEPADAADLGPLAAARQSPSLAAFRFRAGAGPRSLSLAVARYAQQAVLTANIEEARYRVLMSGEGKTLVQARYSVRNNQRNFVRVTLPEGAVLWSASLAGRAIRPGKAPDGGLLLPLSKGRAGEEAPVFALEVLFLARGVAWNAKGRATLTLPALDLPVSRTGMMLYHPPLFRVASEPGVFRVQSFEAPASPALNSPNTPSPPPEPAQVPNQKSPQSAAQALVDGYRARSDARKAAAAAPVLVTFPAVGPSLFLVSELTAEGHSPIVKLNFQKERKGDAR